MLRQNPFSLYDFLGYFTPGAIFLYCVLLTIGHSSTGSFSLSHVQIGRAENYVPYILAAYLSGHFLSFLSSITIERYSIWAHGYPSKYLLGVTHRGYFFGAQPFVRKVVRIIVASILAPISFFDWLLGKVGMRELYAKELDPLLIDVLRRRITSLISDHAEIEYEVNKYGPIPENDFFRYVYHFALENAPSHLTKMQNYVALYGFLRTIAFIVSLLFWAVVWHALTGLFSIGTAVWTILVFGVLAYLMFMAFVKFYRRFSLEALMAMAVNYSPQDQTRSSQATSQKKR